MAQESTIKRRSFVKLCASAVAAVSASPKLLARGNRALHRYQRVRLVDAWGKPIAPAHLDVGASYVFPYPYQTTPCFLLNLGTRAEPQGSLKTEHGDEYRWPGGVGPERSVVAFSAICAHKMSHPARSISFINYRHQRVRFVDRNLSESERAQVIFCCSEKSVYDPARGAQVLGGPAPQPLAAILLEHHPEDDTLTAAGTFGGEMFERYFASFSERLILEYKTDDVRRRVAGESVVVPIDEFCERQVLC